MRGPRFAGERKAYSMEISRVCLRAHGGSNWDSEQIRLRLLLRLRKAGRVHLRAVNRNLKILEAEGSLVRQRYVNERQIGGAGVFEFVVRGNLQRRRVAGNEADLVRLLDGAVSRRQRGVAGIAAQQKKKREQSKVERARNTGDSRCEDSTGAA